jgi:hypothetical protein
MYMLLSPKLRYLLAGMSPIQNPAQSHVNVPTSQPKGVVVLNSQETLDTITYFKTKKEDHLTSHLPVTYSVLRES